MGEATINTYLGNVLGLAGSETRSGPEPAAFVLGPSITTDDYHNLGRGGGCKIHSGRYNPHIVVTPRRFEYLEL